MRYGMEGILGIWQKVSGHVSVWYWSRCYSTGERTSPSTGRPGTSGCLLCQDLNPMSDHKQKIILHDDVDYFELDSSTKWEESCSNSNSCSFLSSVLKTRTGNSGDH